MYYWHWLRNIVRRPLTTGFPTEPDADMNAMTSADGILPGLDESGAKARIFRRSLGVRHIDAGSCNGCESELSMLISPDYDWTRYGFSYTPSPKHADLLIVTGVITDAMVPVIQQVYEQMPAPKKVVAVGICAVSGGIFLGAPGIRGSLDNVVPVSIRIDGCPPTPTDILRGLLWAVDGADPLESKEVTS